MKPPKVKQPQISVVIPAYNEELLLSACLKSVLNQRLDRNDYEIIVVDNGSTDKTAAIAKAAGARVVYEQKKGYVNALKKGIEESQSEIIAITDADAQVPPDWLEKISHSFEEDKDLMALGGVYKFLGSNPIHNFLSLILKFSIAELVGSSMAFRKKAYLLCGGFDSKMNLAADVYLSIKLRTVGKVKIDRNNMVLVSPRRIRLRYFKDLFLYALNYLWLLIFRRTLIHADFPDIR